MSALPLRLGVGSLSEHVFDAQVDLIMPVGLEALTSNITEVYNYQLAFVPGVELSAIIGSLTAEGTVNAVITGVALNASAGDVQASAINDAQALIDGVELSARIGLITVDAIIANGDARVQGASLQAIAGTITVYPTNWRDVGVPTTDWQSFESYDGNCKEV